MEREPSFFPSAYSTTRLFPRLTFLEALELVVDQAGLTTPDRGESLSPEPRRSPTTPDASLRAAEAAEAPARNWIAVAAEAAVAAFQRPRTLEAAKARGMVSRWGLRCVAERLRFGVVDESVALPSSAHDRLFGRLVLPTLDERGSALWMSGRYVSLRSAAALQAQHIQAFRRLRGIPPVPYNYLALERASDDGVVIVTKDEIEAATLLAALDPSGQATIPVISLSHDPLPSHWATVIARTEALIILAMDVEATDAIHALRLVEQLRLVGCRLAPCFVPPPGCHTLNEALCTQGAASLAMALCQHLEEVTYSVRRAQGWRRWACPIA